MAIKNSARNGCKDVFRSYLVRGAKFAGNLELPVLKPSFSVPEKVITFSKAIRSTDYECWVHFYEDDANFERIWNNPQKYLPCCGIQPLARHVRKGLLRFPLQKWKQETGLWTEVKLVLCR